MFEPEASYGYSPEEIPAMVAQTVQAWAVEDPEGFLDDLISRGRTEDTEALLRLLAPEATEEDIEELFAPPVPFEIPPQGYQFVQEVTVPVREVEGVTVTARPRKV
ncbi:unnamed protein product, partial [marine sediment metagenome]